MAIYQTKRYLIDATNRLELPLGYYVETECELWVKRFGDDLLLTDADLTGTGFIVRKLTGLKEESMTQPPIMTSPHPNSSEPAEVPVKRAIRKKITT